jgi:hypothetical protein
MEKLRKFLSEDERGKDFTIKVPDRNSPGKTIEKKVKPKLNLLTFNFGVNSHTRLGMRRLEEEDARNSHNLQCYRVTIL